MIITQLHVWESDWVQYVFNMYMYCEYVILCIYMYMYMYIHVHYISFSISVKYSLPSIEVLLSCYLLHYSFFWCLFSNTFIHNYYCMIIIHYIYKHCLQYCKCVCREVCMQYYYVQLYMYMYVHTITILEHFCEVLTTIETIKLLLCY